MFEVYSEVRAVLSSHFVNTIEGCVLDAIRHYALMVNIEQVPVENGMQYHIKGSLGDIQNAKLKLEELVTNLHIKRLAKQTDIDSTTLSEGNSSAADDGNTSYEKEGTDKTSCLSDDKELETNASSNGSMSTASTPCRSSARLISKKLRCLPKKEKPRVSQRTRTARMALQLRTLKKKFLQRKIRNTRNDPDVLSENLEQMKLVTEESDVGASDSKRKRSTRLTLRMRNHDSSSSHTYYCKLCSFRTKRDSHLKKHMAVHEKVGVTMRCGQCSFSCIRLSDLSRHRASSHSGSALHTCSDCSYRTDNIKSLLRHTKLKHCGFKKHDKNSTLVLSCRFCSYQTTRQHYYERHQRLHCSKRAVVHQCEQCPYRTHRKEHFVRHMNSAHGDIRPYLCHVCGGSFKRADALRQHQITHSPETDKSYTCVACEKQFRSQRHLREHSAVHADLRRFLCELCGASFRTRSVHHNHVQTIHRNPRAHPCEMCPKRFNTLYSLNRHKKVHSTKSGPRDAKSATPTTTENEPESPAPSETKNYFSESSTLRSENAGSATSMEISHIPMCSESSSELQGDAADTLFRNVTSSSTSSRYGFSISQPIVTSSEMVAPSTLQSPMVSSADLLSTVSAPSAVTKGSESSTSVSFTSSQPVSSFSLTSTTQTVTINTSSANPALFTPSTSQFLKQTCGKSLCADPPMIELHKSMPPERNQSPVNSSSGITPMDQTPTYATSVATSMNQSTIDSSTTSSAFSSSFQSEYRSINARLPSRSGPSLVSPRSLSIAVKSPMVGTSFVNVTGSHGNAPGTFSAGILSPAIAQGSLYGSQPAAFSFVNTANVGVGTPTASVLPMFSFVRTQDPSNSNVSRVDGCTSDSSTIPPVSFMKPVISGRNVSGHVQDSIIPSANTSSAFGCNTSGTYIAGVPTTFPFMGTAPASNNATGTCVTGVPYVAPIASFISTGASSNSSASGSAGILPFMNVAAFSSNTPASHITNVFPFTNTATSRETCIPSVLPTVSFANSSISSSNTSGNCIVGISPIPSDTSGRYAANSVPDTLPTSQGSGSDAMNE